MRKETKRLRRIAKLLRQRTAGPPCNPDGTFTVGNCPPDALCHEAASAIEMLAAGLERLRTQVRNLEDAAEAANRLPANDLVAADVFKALRARNDQLSAGVEMALKALDYISSIVTVGWDELSQLEEVKLQQLTTAKDVASVAAHKLRRLKEQQA